MRYRFNIFTKIVILILAMLIPIICLYVFSFKVSNRVLETELNKSKVDQLVFFQNQVDSNIDRLSQFPNTLIQDPEILSFQDIYLKSEMLNLNEINLIKRIESKIFLQGSSANWNNQLYVYSPSIERVVSTDITANYDAAELRTTFKQGWQGQRTVINGKEQFNFLWYMVLPYSAFNNLQEANLIIKVKFSDENIKDMLDKFKQNGRSDPFYYKKGVGTIYNRTAQTVLSSHLISLIEESELQKTGNKTLRLDGKDYIVNWVKSERLDWYLIDYIPLEAIIKPITQSNTLFYLSTAVLLFMSCLAAYLLYVQVQVPIKAFIISFQALKNGDYSVRIHTKTNNEFSFLFERFNLMVSRIQELIEFVYLEKIHSREAKLKQLQSQINPHFLYNCFSFISSMAKLNSTDSIIAMSENLSKYYRYTTRQEKRFVSLDEELQFIAAYLKIQKMRMPRLTFLIDVPLSMKKAMLPPLSIQPIVENAIIHGIEGKMNAGKITIMGECADNEYRIIIEDDGLGMNTESLDELQERLTKSMDDEMGCGMWSVHQRLVLNFGPKAGIEITPSHLGGLKVVLHWGTDTQIVKDSGGETYD